jgi:hypothetical protein
MTPFGVAYGFYFEQRYVFWKPTTLRPITDIGNLWSKLRDDAGSTKLPPP